MLRTTGGACVPLWSTSRVPAHAKPQLQRSLLTWDLAWWAHSHGRQLAGLAGLVQRLQDDLVARGAGSKTLQASNRFKIARLSCLP